jgi:hypothetical protein
VAAHRMMAHLVIILRPQIEFATMLTLKLTLRETVVHETRRRKQSTILQYYICVTHFTL